MCSYISHINQPRAPKLLPYTTTPQLRVRDLIDSTTNQWDYRTLCDLTEQDDHHLTIHIQLSPLQPENKQFGFIPEMGSSQLDMVIISMEADDSHRATQPPPALHPDMSNNI